MKKRRWPAVLLVFVLLIGLAAPFAAYEIGEKCLAAGDYDTAALIFEMLGAFQDSSQRVVDVENARIYDDAMQKMSAGEYDGALAHFMSLGDYQDSPALAAECLYQKAVSLLAYGNDVNYENIAQAREIFLSLGNYKDSAEFLTQFQVANIYISREKLHSGESMGREPQWYDARGRLTGRGTSYDQYGYDDQNRLIREDTTQIEYDEEGRISKEIGDKRTITYSYSKEGKVVGKSYYYSASSTTKEHTYRYITKYSDGLLQKETMYDNDKLWNVNTYVYDEQGRIVENGLQSYGGKPHSTDYIFRYAYNEDGTLHRKEQIYPDVTDSFADTYLYGYIWTPEA